MLRVLQLITTLIICWLPLLVKARLKVEQPRKEYGMTYISEKDSRYFSRVMPKYSFFGVLNVLLFFLIVYKFECNLNGAIQSSVASLFCCLFPLTHINYKEVALTDGGLWISNYESNIVVPAHEIKRMGQRKTWMYVKFKNKTIFGKTIVFSPVDVNTIKKLMDEVGIECKLMGYIKSPE